MKAALICIFAVLLACAVGAPGVRAADMTLRREMKLVATKDASLCSVPEERDNNTGGAGRFKLKYLEEMGLVGFDLSALRGSRVVSAYLYCHSVPESARAELARLNLPESFIVPLRRIGVSTVSSRWKEGNAVAKPARGGATFNEAVSGEKPWAWRGSRLWNVIFGSGNSVHSHGEIEKLDDYWWRVKVDPRVIDMLVAGGGDGICVMEESIAPWENSANSFIHSSEAAEFAPYLVVEAEDVSGAPAAPADVRVEPAPEAASFDSGAVNVTLTVPEGAILYSVKVDGERLEPWRVALPGASGATQKLRITDLPPERAVEISFAAVGLGGTSSPEVSLEARTPKALLRPQPSPRATPADIADSAVKTYGGAMRVWAYPEIVKVDPVTTELLSGGEGEGKGRNSVWDASSGVVSLTAARGEIAAFQVAVEAAAEGLSGVKVELDVFKGESEIPASGVTVYREWYVRPNDERPWQAEFAVPLSEPVSIPHVPNKVDGQRLQSFWVDVVVPKEASAGEYEGCLRVSAEGVDEVSLPVMLDVKDVVIPDELSFWGELNGYGAPGGAGTPYYYDAHRLAHYHRSAINIVPYNQGREGDVEFRPAIEGAGASTRVVNWELFDRTQGPLLDGSAFEGLPRSGVPVNVFYLPFFEYWPAEFLENYAWEGEPSPENLNLNYLTAPAIEDAVSDDFQDAWKAVMPEFVRHFNEKGWTDTIFECYLNNKWWMSKTMFWNLDECAIREDYQALRFFMKLFHESLGDTGDVRILFRGDISRPQWQFEDFDGFMDIEYVNSGVVDMVRTVREVNQRAGSVFVVYGALNEPSRGNFETLQWCLNSYVAGGLGVLPWNSFETRDVYTKGASTGLIVPGGPMGFDGPVASLRVFAMRRGVENVELLKALAEKEGWTLDQVGAFANNFVPLGSAFNQRFTDEAAAAEYDAAGSAGLSAMRLEVFDRLAGR